MGNTVFQAPGHTFAERDINHELAHVEQYRVLGALFLPLYFATSTIPAQFGVDHDQWPLEWGADRRRDFAESVERSVWDAGRSLGHMLDGLAP